MTIVLLRIIVYSQCFI